MNTELSTSPSPLSRNVGHTDDPFSVMTNLLVKKGKKLYTSVRRPLILMYFLSTQHECSELACRLVVNKLVS